MVAISLVFRSAVKLSQPPTNHCWCGRLRRAPIITETLGRSILLPA